jgi:hypothetical protein
MLLNENGEEVSVGDIDFKDILDRVLRNENEIVRVGDVKAKTLYVPKGR